MVHSNMTYHATLENYTNELNEAIELVDIEKVERVCREAIALIKKNEPLQESDRGLVEKFANSHSLAESLLINIKNKLVTEAGRSKHARKGIKQYKGVSSNV